MSWIGWVEFGGNEIVNAERTEAYAAKAGWFRPSSRYLRTGGLAAFLDHAPYSSDPISDDADWTDPDVPVSGDFWGCYPLNIAGIDDSTVTAPVTESTVDGGSVGAPRAGTRSIVFNVALLGGSEGGVDYGLRWLRSVLGSNPCGQGGDCSGSTLCYLSAAPCSHAVCNSNCVDPEERNRRKVAVTVSVSVTSKAVMSDGGCMATASFTLVAGDPFEYGEEIDLIRGFMNPNVANPYVGGTPANGFWDDSGAFALTDPPCPTQVYTPVYDPNCPAVIPPPNVPNVPLSCFSFPDTYRRRVFTVPEQIVPLWSSAVPTLTIRAKEELRTMRLRIFPDIRNNAPAIDEPCAFCGDIVFTYIPAKGTLIFDGTDRQVYILDGAAKRRADSLVFATDGTPFEWPEMSCGSSYIMAFDMPASQTPPIVSLTLTPKAV